MYICIYTYIHTYIRTYIYIYICITTKRTSISTYIYIYFNETNKYIYIHIHICICTHKKHTCCSTFQLFGHRSLLRAGLLRPEICDFLVQLPPLLPVVVRLLGNYGVPSATVGWVCAAAVAVQSIDHTEWALRSFRHCFFAGPGSLVGSRQCSWVLSTCFSSCVKAVSSRRGTTDAQYGGKGLTTTVHTC